MGHLARPATLYLKYGRGDYTGISDVREVYYDPGRRSPTNNHRGATWRSTAGGATS